MLGVSDQHRSRIHPLRRDVVIGERRGDDAAAHDFARREDRIERSRRHFAQHGKSTHQTDQLVEIGADRRLQRRPARRRNRGRHGVMAIEQRTERRFRARCVAFLRMAGRLDQLVGDARKRRHDDDGRTWRPLAHLAAYDSDQPVDRVRIGDRRAAEFHHHAHWSLREGRWGRWGG